MKAKLTSQFTSIGGQAIIEGVMMRSPHYIAMAVRKADQRIRIRFVPFVGFSQSYPLLRKPVFRGIVTLVESMIEGIRAFSFSANIALESEGSSQRSKVKLRQKDAPLSNWAIAVLLLVAFVFGTGLFVVLPHILAAVFASQAGITLQNPLFHLLDGVLKMGILLAYVYFIAFMKDIHRVFQYHGAEHKSIYTFEAGEELTVANAKKYTTLHPRCGTSFLLFLVLISVVVFSVIFPLFQLTALSAVPLVNHVLMILVKMVLMFPVAGLAYEFIKACAFRMDRPFFRALIWPGMILQKLTTREPTDDQLEVALASLGQVLNLEKKRSSQERDQENELEINSIADLSIVQAKVAEFPE
jgi:uncharacterized protein YqhQ